MLVRQIRLASQHDVQKIITSYLPVGVWQNFAMLAEGLTSANIHIDQVVREYDRLCWPVQRGFFRLRKIFRAG